MRYLCLAYAAEATIDALAPEQRDALRRETLDSIETLRQRGQLIATGALQSARTAITVRVRNGAVSLRDGPFAETSEQLGGIFLIEARDLNAAIRIASSWPSVRLGSIEVRPIETELQTQACYAAL